MWQFLSMTCVVGAWTRRKFLRMTSQSGLAVARCMRPLLCMTRARVVVHSRRESLGWEQLVVLKSGMCMVPHEHGQMAGMMRRAGARNNGPVKEPTNAGSMRLQDASFTTWASRWCRFCSPAPWQLAAWRRKWWWRHSTQRGSRWGGPWNTGLTAWSSLRVSMRYQRLLQGRRWRSCGRGISVLEMTSVMVGSKMQSWMRSRSKNQRWCGLHHRAPTGARSLASTTRNSRGGDCAPKKSHFWISLTRSWFFNVNLAGMWSLKTQAALTYGTTVWCEDGLLMMKSTPSTSTCASLDLSLASRKASFWRRALAWWPPTLTSWRAFSGSATELMTTALFRVLTQLGPPTTPWTLRRQWWTWSRICRLTRF